MLLGPAEVDPNAGGREEPGGPLGPAEPDAMLERLADANLVGLRISFTNASIDYLPVVLLWWPPARSTAILGDGTI